MPVRKVLNPKTDRLIVVGGPTWKKIINGDDLDLIEKLRNQKKIGSPKKKIKNSKRKTEMFYICKFKYGFTPFSVVLKEKEYLKLKKRKSIEIYVISGHGNDTEEMEVEVGSCTEISKTTYNEIYDVLNRKSFSYENDYYNQIIKALNE